VTGSRTGFWAVVVSLAAATAATILGAEHWLGGAPAPAAAISHVQAPSGPWTGYLAPESDCPADDGRGSRMVQEQTMLCLINWARARHGVRPINASVLLMATAAEKGADLVACDDFAHEACGKAADTAFTARVGAHVRSRFGENLAWGTRYSGLPRHILNGWLRSEGHRTNLLHADWREQGIAYVRARSFEGASDAHVWVSHFASVG
jgi:uncharacterized protein YkwD